MSLPEPNQSARDPVAPAHPHADLAIIEPGELHPCPPALPLRAAPPPPHPGWAVAAALLALTLMLLVAAGPLRGGIVDEASCHQPGVHAMPPSGAQGGGPPRRGRFARSP